MAEYGYCRISRPSQNIERQIRNIRTAYPNAVIIQEVFTGTQTIGRKKWEQLYKTLQEGDTVIFDSVSRMSRNADDGYAAYEELYTRGVNLVYLKEPHIDSKTYRNVLENNIPMTGTNVDFILEGVNKYLLALAKEQIRLAFAQAEKEVQDLHQRTREGIQTARLQGKQIGQRSGVKLTTKKSVAAKADILKYSKEFGGALNDIECMRIIGISRNTFYKYKHEIYNDRENQE